MCSGRKTLGNRTTLGSGKMGRVGGSMADVEVSPLLTLSFCQHLFGCGRGPTPARSRGAPPPREDRASGPVAADNDSVVARGFSPAATWFSSCPPDLLLSSLALETSPAPLQSARRSRRRSDRRKSELHPRPDPHPEWSTGGVERRVPDGELAVDRRQRPGDEGAGVGEGQRPELGRG